MKKGLILFPHNEILQRQIVKVTNHSTPFNRRKVVHFSNGYAMSIATTDNTHFEIAPIDKQGNFDGSIVGLRDDITDGLNAKQVDAYCKRMVNAQ